MKLRLAALLGILAAGAAFGVEVKNLNSMKAPGLDGIIAPGEWNGAFKGKLVELRSGGKPVQDTEYYIGCDRDNLYVAFLCHESKPNEMRRKFTHSEERDNSIYTDDCIEIFCDPFGTPRSGSFHFIVNSNGIIFDSLNSDLAYHSGIKVACKVAPPGWTAEVAIPFVDLGIVPGGGEVIRVGLGRERYSSPQEFSVTKAGKGGFGDPSRWIAFRPIPEGAVIPPVTVYGFGSEINSALLFGNSDASDTKEYKVLVEMLNDKNEILRKYDLKAKPGKVSTFEYRLGRKNKAAGIKLSVMPDSGKGAPVYASTFHFPKSSESAGLKALAVENPIFDELVGTEPKNDYGFFGFQWMFGVGNKGYMQNFARQFAMPYSNYDMCKEFRDTGMANYTNVTMIDWANTTLHGNELNTPLCIMPRVLARNVKCGLSYQLNMVPEIRELYLADVRKLAKGKNVKAMCFGDEMAEVIESRLIEDFIKFPKSKELLVVDAEIKSKYGRGKYGIPKSIEERDPLAWIAYRRYINDKLVELFHQAYKLVKSINPDIVVISDDPVGNQSKVYSYADWKGAYDIVTHQLYPRGRANIDSFGFFTRYLADLTGAKEVWPCAHVEEYGASFTSKETLLKLSSAVRNGATGFHYYLNDTVGRGKKEKYLPHEIMGAPNRYAVEIGAQKLLAKTPYFKKPTTDTAIFTSTDSLRAIPGLMLRNPPDSDIYIFNLLGYGAGVWFRFINERSLENLSQYKFIVTNECEYIEAAALAELRRYVENGGTLLILNPNGLKKTPEGDSLDAERASFTGIVSSKPADAASTMKWLGHTLSVAGARVYSFRTNGETSVAARFDNGAPAVIERKLGKGRVLTMAINPSAPRFAMNQDWRNFFQELSENFGSKTRVDMWRLQLPESLIPEPVTIPGTCITNNFVLWKSFNPTRPNDSECTGSYTLTPAPNKFRDVKTGEISFKEGKLTDRPRAVLGPSACDGASSPADWSVAWETAEPVVIKSRWSEKKPINKVKLFVDGVWRDAKLKIGGKSYSFPCPQDFNKDTMSMREVVMELPSPVETDELQIEISPNPAMFCIAEMEIWSDK